MARSDFKNLRVNTQKSPVNSGTTRTPTTKLSERKPDIVSNAHNTFKKNPGAALISIVFVSICSIAHFSTGLLTFIIATCDYRNLTEKRRYYNITDSAFLIFMGCSLWYMRPLPIFMTATYSLCGWLLKRVAQKQETTAYAFEFDKESSQNGIFMAPGTPAPARSSSASYSPSTPDSAHSPQHS